MKPRAPDLLVKVLLAGCGVILALAIAEVGLRIARIWSPRVNALLYSPTVQTRFDLIQTTPDLLATSTFGYHPLGHTPGFVLNSRGFRTDEYTVTKPPGVFRVVALGDSFTFDSCGVPIQQMWHQVFERKLARLTGREVEVLSLSAPGVGPRFELRLWELEGARLAPDLVVLAFFVGNDFTDESGTPLGHSLETGMARWSVTFRLLRNLARLRHVRPSTVSNADAALPAGGKGGFELPSYAATYDPNVPTFDEPEFDRIERERSVVIAGPDRETFDRLVAETTPVLAKLAWEVAQRGAKLVVMLIPDQAQVQADLGKRVLSGLSSSVPGLDFDRPQRVLDAWLNSADIPALDLLSLFRQRAPAETLYKLRDTHWSAHGNLVAGQALAEFVVDHQVGPTAKPGR